MRDPYSVLGVSRGADKKTIRRAYIALAKKFHPDQFSSEKERRDAEEKMKEINAAYDILTSDGSAAGTASYSSYSSDKNTNENTGERVKHNPYYAVYNDPEFVSHYHVNEAFYANIEDLIGSGRLNEAQAALNQRKNQNTSTAGDYLCMALLSIAMKKYNEAYNHIYRAYYWNARADEKHRLDEKRIVELINRIQKLCPERVAEDAKMFLEVEMLINDKEYDRAMEILLDFINGKNSTASCAFYYYTSLICSKRKQDAVVEQNLELAGYCYEPTGIYMKRVNELKQKRADKKITPLAILSLVLLIVFLPIWLPILLIYLIYRGIRKFVRFLRS